MAQEFDLIVIGAGPGGYPAALRAAEGGRRVAVIEKDELGGTCLNRGCIPTKTLLHASGLYRRLQEAQAEGLSVSEAHVDMARLQERRLEVISSLREGIAVQFQKKGVILFTGTGRILEKEKVLVTTGKEEILLTAPRILIRCPADSGNQSARCGGQRRPSCKTGTIRQPYYYRRRRDRHGICLLLF